MSTASGSNGFDPKTVAEFVTSIERHKETLLSYQGEYMQKCRSIRDLIARAKDSAKEASIPKKQLNALLKERDLLRKIEKISDDFEDDEDLETFEALKDALGDFGDSPLGAAALNAKEAKGGKGGKKKNGAAAGDDDKDVRPRHLQEAERQRVEENTARLEKGISGLPGADATEA